MSKKADETEVGQGGTNPVVPEKAEQISRRMIWWCIGTLLVIGSSWFLLKGDGRQLVAAAGELLRTGCAG